MWERRASRACNLVHSEVGHRKFSDSTEPQASQCCRQTDMGTRREQRMSLGSLLQLIGS